MTCLIIHYNEPSAVERLVADLLAQDMDLKIVVVDDASRPEHLSRVRELRRHKGVVVHELTENVGYFGSVRRAYEALPKLDVPDWVIVSSSDLEIDDHSAIRRLVSGHPPDIALVGPHLVSTLTGRAQNPLMVRRPSRRRLRFHLFIAEHPVLFRAYLALHELRSRVIARTARARRGRHVVYAVHGAFFAVSQHYFRLGGDFAHPAFLMGEELSMAERSRMLGLRTVYDGDVHIRHREHGAGTAVAMRARYSAEGLTALIQRWWS